MKFILTIIIMIIFTSFSEAQDATYFPPTDGTEWDTLPPSEMDWCQYKIDSLYSFLDSIDTKSFIVLKNGKIVLEKYFGTYTMDSTFSWYSAAKSFRAVLIGKAQEENYLTINDTVSAYLGSGWTSLDTDQEDSILIKHQITMTTGLDETNFLCVNPICLNYVAPVESRWAYHNGPYSLTKNILETATGVSQNFYSNTLENEIGMNGVWLTFLGNSSYYSNARDMARFGLFISENAVWNSDTLLHDSDYIYDMTHSSQALNPSYGYLWWLNGQSHYISTGSPETIIGSIAPDAPEDIYVAAGSKGQFISVSPSNELIMIRQGLSEDESYTEFGIHNEIWKRIMDLTCGTSSFSNESNIKSLRVYPNPSNESITFDFEDDNKNTMNVSLYDLVGNLIFERSITNKETIDLHDLPAGVYFIKVGKSEKSIQFIKN